MMSLVNKYSLLVPTVLLTSLAWSDCLPFMEARNHVGEVKCVTGTVVRVKQGARGVHFLDFCDDFRLCPFTVVIFPHDLKSVGDVRQLQGRMVEIHGQVKEYDGRAEIILEEYRQLGGAGARIPPLPKNYDVEKKGRYSAGTFNHPKAKRKTSRNEGPNVITQAPEDPEQ
jgi:DNA/RNA endonuclease YhcR with UshA esterase domain